MKIRIKNSGFALIIAFIFGTIVLTAGVGLLKILAKEIQFSSDLLFTERAYFAAESGVEKALIALKNEPVENIKDYKIEDFINETGAKANLTINNLIKSFKFDLPPKENAKFRLKKDINTSATSDLHPVLNWNLNVERPSTVSADVSWQWKILCQKNDKTISIQNVLEISNYNNFTNQQGTFIDENGNSISNKRISDFFDTLTDPDNKRSCFFSATNLSETEGHELHFTFTNTDPPEIPEQITGMPPAITTVTSIGSASSRSKIVKFNYSQKKLGTLFDFVLFHSE